jgi:hypothetical protein
LATTLHAQWVVFDPSNYAEAVTQFEQLVKQYQFLLAQARRMPVDIASRYRGYSIDWTQHDLAGLLSAAPLITALNHAGQAGPAYAAVSDPLDVFADVTARMPVALTRGLLDTYATLELADSANRLAIDQLAMGRTQGPLTRQTIDHLEADNANGGDDFQSQTALLERLSTSNAIQLREHEQTNQLLLGTLEQQFVESKRKRDAETRVMNATIYQWRYGQAYGADLFRNTASNLDTWQPY